MSLYRCTIAKDGDGRQIIVHWDDNDPNTHIVSPVTVPASELDEVRLDHEIGRMGFRLVSTLSDNLGRGWAVVANRRTDRPIFDPVTRRWYAFLSDEQKAAIQARYPDADVPGQR